MNSTWLTDQVSMLEVVVTEPWFFTGSSTSSSADEGSPRPVGADLSTSSSRSPGYRAHVAQRARYRPRPARRCRCAEWPPDLRLVADAAGASCTKLAAQALAINRRSEVLPVPGGPTSVRMAHPPRRRWSRLRPAPGRPRSLRTTRYSTMRYFTSSRPAWSTSSTCLAWTGRAGRGSDAHGTGQRPIGYAADPSTMLGVSSRPCAPARWPRPAPSWPPSRASSPPASSSCGVLGRPTLRPRPSSLRIASICWVSRFCAVVSARRNLRLRGSACAIAAR